MNERGDIRLGPIVGIVVIALALVGLFAICEEDENDLDTLGRVELVSHDYGGGYEDGDDNGQEYEDNWGGEDRNRNRGRNRGAFSPGPFDRSPIDMRNACISLDCSGREPAPDEDQPEEGQP